MSPTRAGRTTREVARLVGVGQSRSSDRLAKTYVIRFSWGAALICSVSGRSASSVTADGEDAA